MAANYERLELLGSGSYGKAWLVHCQRKNKRAVLKEIRLDILSEKEMSQALVEVKILSRCRHVNIVSYHEAFVGMGCLQIIMEYADNGDLQKRILDQKGLHFDNEIILDWFVQICFALKYLHSENILHRDLKPQNLFLASDGIVKVGDFGIARILHDTADHAVTAIGTPYYLSPEICQRKPYNFKSDIWSVGCVLYELCCLRVPFQAQNLPLLVLKILDGQVDPLPSHCGPVLEDLVSVLLRINPSRRPTAEQILNVPALLPYVKMSYKKCLRHKGERHRERSLSRDIISAAQPMKFDPERGERPKPIQKTYTVKSPLLRHLSVATPQLKKAIKRQRAVHSADAATVEKRMKNGSPPSMNLLRQVMGKPPTCYSRHCSEYEDEIGKLRDGPDILDDDNASDDVFDDGLQLKNAEKRQEKKSPEHVGCEAVKYNSPHKQLQMHKASKNNGGNVEGGKAVLRSNLLEKGKGGKALLHKKRYVSKSRLRRLESASSIENINAPKGKELQSNYVNSPVRVGPGTVKSAGACMRKGVDNFKADVKSEDVNRHHVNSRHTSCDKVSTRMQTRTYADDVNSPDIVRYAHSNSRARHPSSNPKVRHPRASPRARHNSKAKIQAVQSENVSLQTSRTNVELCASNVEKKRSMAESSFTYSIEHLKPMMTNGNLSCSCIKNISSFSQCMHEVLYKAVVLRPKDEKLAKQALSQYLQNHLGAEQSWRLLSSVGAALDSGEQYCALESSIDKQSLSCLPVVLQLLTMHF